MKKLLRQLQHISNELKEEKEIAIMEKYGWNARCYTNILTCKIIFQYIIYTFSIFSTQACIYVICIIYVYNICTQHNIYVQSTILNETAHAIS